MTVNEPELADQDFCRHERRKRAFYVTYAVQREMPTQESKKSYEGKTKDLIGLYRMGKKVVRFYV